MVWKDQLETCTFLWASTGGDMSKALPGEGQANKIGQT